MVACSIILCTYLEADPLPPMVLIGHHRIRACSPALTSSCCQSTSEKTLSAYRDGRQRAPWSRPTPYRSTSNTTTTLAFTMHLGVEGVMTMWSNAYKRA